MLWTFVINKISVGLIADAFSAIRDDKETVMVDNQSKCLVCSLDMYTFDEHIRNIYQAPSLHGFPHGTFPRATLNFYAPDFPTSPPDIVNIALAISQSPCHPQASAISRCPCHPQASATDKPVPIFFHPRTRENNVYLPSTSGTRK
jgi:hypothetical protein